jgi:hypothetical protein
MTPQEALLKAAEDIEEYGLHKGGYFDCEDFTETDPALCRPKCAMGALSAVIFGHPDWLLHDPVNALGGLAVKARKLLADAIRVEWGTPYLVEVDFSVVTAFNDREEATAEDVARMMRKAAGA